MKERLESTVTTLQEFYTVIVGVAFVGGVEKIVTSVQNARSAQEWLPVAILGLAFLSTIVPFYHGMNRHLYDTHLDVDAKSTSPQVPLLLDIFAFVVEGAILVAMGRALENPESFLRLWTALLLVDILWSLVIWTIQGSEWPRWVLNNGVWIAVAWFVWLGLPPFASPPGAERSVLLRIALLAVVEIGRSITDYKTNWQFYFPSTAPVVPVTGTTPVAVRPISREPEES